MNKSLIFDEYEDLMMKSNAFLSVLTKLPTLPNSPKTSASSNLIATFTTIQKQSETFFDNLINLYLQETQKSAKLFKKLQHSKYKANKYLTLQRELSYREKKVKLKNKTLASSLKKLRKVFRDEVHDLESSLKKQQKLHSKLSSEYNSSLEAIEKEFTLALEVPIACSKEVSMDTSREFEELMKECNIGQEIGVDNSRISMEKNFGGWASEYDSDRESDYETSNIKKAINVLIKANLIDKNTGLNKLNELLSEKRNSESMELLLQLVDIKASNKEIYVYEDTTPMNSELINESVLQTIVPHGHKGSVLFENSELEPESFLEIN